MANPFDQFDSPASAQTNPFDQFDKPAESATAFLTKKLKSGIEQLPGLATGIADIAPAITTGTRPFTTAADWIGEQTGFQPGKWAKQIPQSEAEKAATADIGAQWKSSEAVLADPNASKTDYAKQLLSDAPSIAGAYLRNPMQTAGQVVESVPSMVAGGFMGKGAMLAGRVAGVGADVAAGTAARAAVPGILERTVGEKLAIPIAAGLGEGVVTSGQQMDHYTGPDQQKNAVASLAAGAGTAAIGALAGRLANKMGLQTAETAMVRVGTNATSEVPMSMKRRILGGMISEAVLQELPQSAQEQVWQNYAEGKPLMDGVVRQGVEGTLAGAVMGAGVNIRGGQSAPEAPPPGANPSTEPVAPSPAPDAPQLGFNPVAGTMAVFPDGSTILDSESSNGTQAVRDPQRAARLAAVGVAEAPPNSPLTAAAITAVDTGAHASAIAAQQTATGVDSPDIQQSAPGINPPSLGTPQSQQETLDQTRQTSSAAGQGQFQRSPSDNSQLTGRPPESLESTNQAAAQTSPEAEAGAQAQTLKAGEVGNSEIPTSASAQSKSSTPQTVSPSSSPIENPIVAAPAPTAQERLAALRAELDTGADAKGAPLNDFTRGMRTAQIRSLITQLPKAEIEAARAKYDPAPAAPSTTTQTAPDFQVGGVDEAVKAGLGAITVSQGGKPVPFKDFSLLVHEDGTAEASVERASNSQGGVKGSGFGAYVALGNELAARGVKLVSGDRQHGPGKDLWARLTQAGYAQRQASGRGSEFVVKAAPDQSTQQPASTAQPQGVTSEPQASQTQPQQTQPEARAAAVAGTPGKVAPPAPAPRPATWRTFKPQAMAVARSMEIDTKGMNLDAIVQAVDHRDEDNTKWASQNRVGKNGQPISEGGVPFKTSFEAKKESKRHPTMRVVPHGTGYALADKTTAQLEAEKNSAKRLRSGQTIPAGQPIPAHAFIANEGGLRADTRPDMRLGGNPRIGGRTLFAGAGKGIGIEKATARLIEEGYLNPGASHDEARALIKRSLTIPQYNYDGTTRIAEIQAEAAYAARITEDGLDSEAYRDALRSPEPEFEDYLAAQQDYDAPARARQRDELDWVDDDFTGAGFDEASLALQNEIMALSEQADALGIDVESLIYDAHDTTASKTNQDYYELAISTLEAAIDQKEAVARGSKNSRQNDGQQGNAPAAPKGRGPAPEVASAPTSPEVAAPAAPNPNSVATKAQAAKAAKAAKPSIGAGVLAQRQNNAAEKFISSAMEQFGLTRQEAQSALSKLQEMKLVKLNAISGQFDLKDGRFWDGEVLRRAAGPDTLTAPTAQDIIDKQDRAEAATQAEKSQQRAADELARRERERKDIAKASTAAADTFELGGNAEQNLSGQQSVFDASAAPADDLSTMFDDIMAETAPAAPPTPAKAPRTAAQSAGSAAKNTAAALGNAIDGLGALFGAKSKGRIGSGLSFDEDTYAQAKPLFIQAIGNLKDASADIREAMRAVINMVTAKFGRETTENMKPYIVRFASDVRDGTITQEELNAASTNADLESNSAEPAAEPAVGDTVPAGARAAADRAGEAGGQASAKAGRGQQNGLGLSLDGTTVAGERGDQPVHSGGQSAELEAITAGSDFREPGGDSGITGVPPEPIPASEVDAVADDGNAGLKAGIERARADKAPIKLADIDSIRATLPQLLPGQQDDVLKAEQRFSNPKGYGMLFTNGTGTGKTFTGLGIIKRFARQGKNNILIAVPDDKIATDWIESGKALGLEISKLKDIKDAGRGIVITSYANMGANDALATRQWDAVVADEAHTLSQDKNGTPTTYLHNLRAITHHPDGAHQRYTMLNRPEIELTGKISEAISKAEKLLNKKDIAPKSIQPLQALQDEAALLRERLNSIKASLESSRKSISAEVASAQGEKRTRLIALSATPFAYEKTVDWAQGYLFDYRDGYPFNETAGAYNQPSPREYYFQTRFGYRMKTGKLTQPDAGVDSGLMQRQFNTELKKSGALAGRMLEVAPDYDRRFVLLNSAIGTRIDEAMQWLSEELIGSRSDLLDEVNEKFGHLQKRYLLEAIKAEAAIPIVKQHMAMGRKVVVFHDYKQGGGFNPFAIKPKEISVLLEAFDKSFNLTLAEFNQKFSDLVNYPFAKMGSPVDAFQREIPGVLLVNGDEKKSDLLARYKRFQDDSTGPLVMLVQSAKNKGWSGHDTTGKNQRVLINIGQPTAPTLAIQQEGRIYRTGQASDAIMRYLNTGTNWERWTFAATIAGRASAAENLGMGESARALKDSLVQSFEEADTYAPGHEGEGKGGKERDKAANNALTEFDRAKALYWANQKKTSRTKAQEGADYFATPEPLGLKMVQWLDARNGEDVLEPSGGHGAIARWFPEKTSKTVIEPSMALRSRLALAMNTAEDRIIDGAFEDHAIANKYDGIAMNPPFGTAGRTAVDHIAKAAQHLRDGGRIVALLPDDPSATAKFDKWFYEVQQRPSKPISISSGDEVFKGDTVYVNDRQTGKEKPVIVGSYDKRNNIFFNVGKTVEVASYAITRVDPTGKRTEEYRPAADLYTVADIKLPSSTFERAGTGVMTRIVVIEKQSDQALAPQPRNIDLSDTKDIAELFDRLEDLRLPPRPKTDPMEGVEAKAPAKTEKPAKASKPMAELGATVVLDGSPYKVTTYTTNAGKAIRGVWVPKKPMAERFGSTFQKRGEGWFVREANFPAQDAAPAAAAPTFSRATTQTKGMTAAQVQAIADKIAAGWTNAPRIVVVANMADPRIPQAARDEDQRQRAKGAGSPEGFVHGGTAYLLADNIPNAERAAAVLLHETIGHIGLQGVFGDGLKSILQQVATMRRADIEAKAEAYKLDLTDPVQRLTAAEEVLAEMAQIRPEIGFVRRAVAAIRNWLRVNVPGFKSLALTDTDIAQAYLIPARGWVDRGRVAVSGGNTPMFSRSPAAAINAAWSTPEKSEWFDDLTYKLQDKQIDTKRVIEAIRTASGALADERNVYLQESLYHGRAAARSEDFVNKELGPLVNAMRMRGLDIAALDEYLHARHAEEANALIAGRNPGIPDGGSGMTTADARAYLAGLDAGQRAKLEVVAAQVDAILARTRQLYADYILESQKTIDGWGAMFANYVPLMREDDGGGTGIGQGFSIKGRETRSRTGSTRKVVDILANIAMQRERAIVRGEKNRVATALVGLAEANPNKEFWHTGPPPLEKVYDAKLNKVVSRPDPMYKSRENVLMAKIKKADGTVIEKAVVFNEDSERAMRMSAALKNLDAAHLEGLLGVSANVTRYFSAVNTQFNPIFGVVNLTRDVQSAILNLSSTPLKGKGTQVAKHVLSALAGVYQDARAARNGQTPNSPWAALHEEFRQEGGQTGFRDAFSDSNDRANAIRRELNPEAWMDSPLGKIFTAGGALKVPLAIAQKRATGLFGWLSDYNLAMENAVRLSAYKVAREQGMSKQQAASLAKELTVNFNRKGQVGSQAGALYAFFNASMQGTARLGETLFSMEPGKPKTLRLSATGRNIVLGGVTLGVMQALLLSAAGFDDEEPPDFVRERSLIIPTGWLAGPDKGYITIPMPLGLHILPNMGRIPTEFALNGFKNPEKKTARLFGIITGAFNPVGGGASLLQTLAPTPIDPLAALAENKDWTGKNIAKTSRNPATPGHLLTKDTASYPAKLLAEAINVMSGGTEYVAGVLSPTPDQIDYLWSQATGGVGREVSKTQQSVSTVFSGEDLPINKIPLAGRFYGNADTPSAQSNKFYIAIDRLNRHEEQIKGLRKDGRGAEVAAYLAENPDARLFMAANAAERQVQNLRNEKRELLKKDAPAERVKLIEGQIAKRMTAFNDLVQRTAR